MRPCLIASMHQRVLSFALTGALCLVARAASGQEPTADEKPSSGEAAVQKKEAEQELTPQQVEEMMREPPSHLAEMPVLRIATAKYESTVEQRDEIAKLIEQLAEIDKPDYGMAPWMSGSQFAPIKSSQQFGSGIIMVDHGLKTSEALEKLVAFGPKALPALLDALEDATPTKHKMEHGGGFGGMWFGREVAINAANPRESKVKETHAEFFKGGEGIAGSDGHINEHAITRGDVCFLIIGQIVNRCYQPSRYQPTACLVVNSPTHDPEIAKIVREIWVSVDPTETLFHSLMTDFHSRGGAAPYQAGAAMRLLYYFPNESRDLIINRLNSLNAASLQDNATEDEWTRHHEANGEIQPEDLIKAVSFSDDPGILQAILRLVQQIDQPYTLSECLNEKIVATDPEMIFRKLEAFIEHPDAADGFMGPEFWPLQIAARYFPDRARPLFEQILKQETVQAKLTCVGALAGAAPAPDWALGFLSPFLDDQTPTRFEYGPDYDRRPMRVCDFAAERMVRLIPDGTFKLEGETGDLDRQVANLKRRIAGQPVVESATTKIDFDAVARRQPLVSFSMAEDFGRIYDFSDEKTLSVSYGYKANCWACDTMTIDVATGQQTSRVRFDEWNGAVEILQPIVGDTAVCFHGGSGGDMVTRDIRTGQELNRIATPFHEGLGRDDPMIVRGLGDIFLTGDGKMAIALTPDASLHSIDLATGKREVLWKREGKPRLEEMGFHGTLIPAQGTNRVLLEFFAEDDQPLRVWDHDSRTMSEIQKVPNDAWRSAWGKYAVNHMNNNIVLWDLEARKSLDLPLPEGAMVSDLVCDHDQSALLVAMADGSVWVIDLKSLTPRAKLQPQATTGRTTITLSRDDRLLFWQADETQHDRETGERHDPKTVFAVFDVSDLVR